MKSAKYFALFLGISILLSSCGSIREARIRENSKPRNPSVHKPKKSKTKTKKDPGQKEENYAVGDVRYKYEKIIGISISKSSTPLYNFIDQWMGVPYCYGGMSTKCTDCSGFVLNLYKEIYKIELPHTSEKQYDMSSKVKQKNLKEGELVFFHTEKGSNAISHVGVYLGNNKFVHASSSKGVRIDDLEEEYYAKAFVSGGNLK